MRIRDLITRISSEIGDVLDGNLVIQWLDSAQLEIAKHYGKVVEFPYVATAGVTYPLPMDHLVTSKVLNTAGDEIGDYIITSTGRIRFLSSGEYNMLYHRVPILLPSLNDPNFESATLEVHPVFNLAIINFCKAAYWDIEADADRDDSGFADKFRAKFQQGMFEGVLVLKRRERQTDIISPGAMW